MVPLVLATSRTKISHLTRVTQQWIRETRHDSSRTSQPGWRLSGSVSTGQGDLAFEELGARAAAGDRVEHCRQRHVPGSVAGGAGESPSSAGHDEYVVHV